MDSYDHNRSSILEWDENDVHAWFSKLGYPQYEYQIKGMFLFRELAIWPSYPPRQNIAFAAMFSV